VKQKIIRRTVLASFAAMTVTFIAPAGAQGSDAPLRVILPVGAGSGVDVTIRTVQNALSRELKQPVVIENLPGAGGITGTSQLVKAAPDGRTIAFVSNNHVVNPSIFKKMPYDTLADITPISVVAETPFVLVVNPSKLPVRTAKELQAALKAKPGGYNYASSGNGTILHLATAMFVDAADVQVRHIPYKGVGPMLTDIMSGQVEFGVTSVPSVQGQLKSGALRAIAVMGDARVASLPDVPTMKEQGFPDVVVGGWFAAIGPKGLPAAEVKRLQAGITQAFNAPDVKEAMAKQENIIRATSPEQAVEIFRTEQARYARIVQKADIKLE
jgi:tripartite-type tricarboxylate transporter receptor subunit TctC